MPRDLLKLLWDIHANASQAVGFVGVLSAEEFRNDALVSAAVERKIYIVGDDSHVQYPRTRLLLC